MKLVFVDYNISTQFTLVITLKSMFIHHRDKQQKSSSTDVYEISSDQEYAGQEPYIG